MATRTISNAGGAWNTVGAWVEGAVPLSNDDVVATATSGNLNITATAVCRSIDLTNYVGTIVQSAVSLSVGDASGGALKFVAGMTFTRSAAAAASITFVSTTDNSGAGWSVDFAGKSISNVTFNGAGGKWVLQSDVSMSGVILTLSAGTLDTASKNITTGTFVSGTGTRTLTPGSSTITLSGSTSTTAWTINTSATMTITANTANVVIASSTTTPTVLGGLVNHNGMSFSMAIAGTLIIGSATGQSGFTIANLTRTGTAALTDSVTFSEVMTITGTLTLNGNSVINRLLVNSTTTGTPVVITCNTTVTGQFVDIRDITAAGTGTWNLASITGGSGNLGGNTGITFTTPANQYWIAHTGTWGVTGNWGSTSGGTGGRVPLPQDTAIFDTNSFSAGGQTVTMTGPLRLSAIDSSAATNTPTFAGGSNAIASYGSVDWSNFLFTGSGALSLSGRSTFNLKIANYGSSLTVAALTGTYTLTGNTSSISTFTHASGTFNTANFNMTASTFTFTASSITFNLGTSTMTATSLSTTTVFGAGTLGAGQANLASATVTVTGKTNGIRSVALGSNTLGTLILNVLDSIGSFSITGTPILGSLIVGPGTALAISSVITVANIQLSGSDLGYVYVNNGQYFLTPDHVDFDITGDLDLIAKVQADDWTPSSNIVLIGRDDPSNISYRLTLLTSSGLRLTLSTNGTATFSTDSTVSLATAIGITDGSDKWVRATRRLSDGRIQFFYSNDGSSWTQLGADQVSTTLPLFAGTSKLAFGATTAAGSLFLGRLYRVIVKNGIGGTTVADLDLANWVPLTSTLVDGAGKTWTFTGTAPFTGDGRIKLSGGIIATYLLDPPTSATMAYPQNIWQQADWTDTSPPTGAVLASTTGYLFIDSQASLVIPGDIDISARILMSDWTPGSRQYVASKAGTPSTSTNISWRFSVESNGSLRFVYTPDGTTQRTATSSVLNTVVNGTAKWVRVTYESASGNVKFYLGDDGVSWTQLGTTQVITAGSIFSSTSRIRVGAGDNTTTGSLFGNIYQFTMKNGVDGTTVAHVNYAERTPQIFQYLEISGNSGLGGGRWVADQGLDDGGNVGWFLSAQTPPISVPFLASPAFVYVPEVFGGVGSGVGGSGTSTGTVAPAQRAGVINRLTVIVRESIVGRNSSSPIPLRGTAQAIGVNANPISVPSLPTPIPAGPLVVGFKAGWVNVGGGIGVATLPSSNPGDLIVLFTGWGDANSTVITPTFGTGFPATQRYYTFDSGNAVGFGFWTSIVTTPTSATQVNISQLPNTFPRTIMYAVGIIRNYDITNPIETFGTGAVEGYGSGAGTKLHSFPSVITTKSNSLILNAAIFSQLVGGIDVGDDGDVVIANWTNPAITGYENIVQAEYFPGSFFNDTISVSGGVLANPGSSGASTATSSLRRVAQYATVVIPPKLS